MSDEKEYEYDDEFEYHAIRVGRPTKTVEVAAPDGTTTIEEGTIRFDVVHRHDLPMAREEGEWTEDYVAPDGKSLIDGPMHGIQVTYELVDIVEFPEPMTEKEAWEWFDDDRMEQYNSELVESDTTAEDVLEDVR